MNIDRKFRCVHISDIHFRGLSRHKQYRESFNDFFDQMNDIKPDIIFVGGDIVHSKTQGISPELIDILSWWFKGLSKSAPSVHIILGNHDGLMLNKERQDAISPILSALNLDNVYLHKKSGTYNTHILGYNFCVFSCFDEEGWENVKPIPNDTNIACFHGSVTDAQTDTNWGLDGDVDVSFFKEYEFAFLGDIHKAQFINGEKTIAFSGSTIQQNFAEHTKKGYLLWEIDDKDNFDVSFKQIKNEVPYITIDWRDTIQETLNKYAYIPKGARIRIQSKTPIQQISWQHLQSYMKENYNVNELVYDLRRDKTQISKSKDDLKLENENFRDINTLIKYMNMWLESLEYSAEEKENIINYYRKIYDQILEPDCLRNVRWSIDSLEFDNIYSYGLGNKINFNALRGINGIFGKNRTGKSSIPGSIMYGLFNGTDRGAIKNNHIINARKNHCKVSIDFTIGGLHYRVERQSVKKVTKQGKEHAVTHMNCFQLNENKEIIKDMSEEQRRETEKRVRSLIGTADNFLLTSFASQGSMNNFIKERATNRKLILTSFLDFSIFDNLNKIARQDLSSLKEKLAHFRRRDFGTIEYEKNIELTKLQTNLKQHGEIKKEINDKLQNIQIKLSQLPTEIITQSDVDQQNVKIQDLKKKIIDLEKEKTDITTSWQNKSDKIKEIRDFLKTYNLEDLKKQVFIYEKIVSNLDIMRKTLINKKRTKNILEKSMSALNEVPCDDLFPTCKFIMSAHESKSELLDLCNKIINIEKNIAEMSSAINEDDINSIRDKIKKIDAITLKANSIEQEIKTNPSRIVLCDEKIKVFEERVALNDAQLRNMFKHISTDPEHNNLNSLKLKKREYETKIRNNDGQQISLAKSIGRLQNEIKNIRKEHEAFKKLTLEWKIVELVSVATSKKGIPLNILTRKLPQVNEEIAQILQGSVEFAIELEVDSDSNSMDIYINYGDSRRIIECASGMEKMMASLAIRVALINLTTLPRSDVLIIDEGFGTLDELNIEACNNLLQNLKKWFKTILVISHIDGIKDSVDNIITITKNGQDSYVNVP